MVWNIFCRIGTKVIAYYATSLEIMLMEERGAFYPVPTQPFFCSPLLQCAPPYTQISGIVHLDSRSALHCCALAVCNLTGLNKVVQQQGGQKNRTCQYFLLILRQSCCPRFDKCCLHFIMKQIVTVFLLSLLNQVGNICK